MPIVVLKGSGKVQKKKRSEDDEPFHLRGMDEVLHMKVYKVSQPHFFTGAVTTTLIGGDIFYKDEDDEEEDALELQRKKLLAVSKNEDDKKALVPSVLQEIRAHKYRSRKRDAQDMREFVKNIFADGDKRKRIQAGTSFHEYLEPSASPDECLAWAIKYVSTNDHNLVETFIRLDERIQRFESGKLEGRYNANGGGNNIAGNGTANLLGKNKDTGDIDRPAKSQKAAISLAQQLDQLKQQGTEAFLRAIQQQPVTAATSDPASTTTTNSDDSDKVMKITNKPPALVPRRPTDDRSMRGSARPGAVGNATPSSSASPNPPGFVLSGSGKKPTTNANRGSIPRATEETTITTTVATGTIATRRARTSSVDSVESTNDTHSASYDDNDDNLEVGSLAQSAEDDETQSAVSSAATVSAAAAETVTTTAVGLRPPIRPPPGPVPSKARAVPASAATSQQKAALQQQSRSGRKVRIEEQPAGDQEDSGGAAAASAGSATSATTKRRLASSSSSRSGHGSHNEPVKYGNHLRPLHAMIDENSHHVGAGSAAAGGGAGSSGSGTSNKPNQFAVMRREQQMLKRTIGAAMQTFARANRKQDALQTKAQTRIERVERAAKKLYAKFDSFETLREDGANEATHLWEEKTQLRASALAAKMRFLSAADTPLSLLSLENPTSSNGVSAPSTANSRSRSASPLRASSPRPQQQSQQQPPDSTTPRTESQPSPQLQQPPTSRGRGQEDFGKPGAQVQQDMRRMRLAAQRDVESQELRALLSPQHKWFLVCVTKMREHLRRSSNTAPPCALKFIFALQLLLRLQAAATGRQLRQQQQQVLMTAIHRYTPRAATAAVAVAVAGPQRKHPPRLEHDDDDTADPVHDDDSAVAATPLWSDAQRPPQQMVQVVDLLGAPHPSLGFSSAAYGGVSIHRGGGGRRCRSRSVSPLRSPSPSAAPRPASGRPLSSPTHTASVLVIDTRFTAEAAAGGSGSDIASPARPDTSGVDNTEPLSSLEVTPRVLSVLLLSAIFTKDDLRKALVQQLVEVVREGVGWQPESFAKFLEKHELPVPAELLNLLRNLAKERTAKRDRERRESSLALTGSLSSPTSHSPRHRQASVGRVSFSSSVSVTQVVSPQAAAISVALDAVRNDAAFANIASPAAGFGSVSGSVSDAPTTPSALAEAFVGAKTGTSSNIEAQLDDWQMQTHGGDQDLGVVRREALLSSDLP